MNDFTKDFAQALFNPDKINDLLRKELQQAVNNLLEAELTAFLGYDPYARNGWNTGNSRNGAYFRKVDTQFGPIEVQVPRDRNGQFHQHTLPDYKQHSDVLESTIIKLYSKGVTTREIADLIEKMYGSHYSPTQVSNISKQMLPKIEAYHIGPRAHPPSGGAPAGGGRRWMTLPNRRGGERAGRDDAFCRASPLYRKG